MNCIWILLRNGFVLVGAGLLMFYNGKFQIYSKAGSILNPYVPIT